MLNNSTGGGAWIALVAVLWFGALGQALAQQPAIPAQFQALGTVRLVTGTDYPPFSGDGLPNGGMLTELTLASFRAVGVPVTYEVQPWRRGYESSRQGRFDGTFPYISTTERRREMLYSDPLFNVDVALYHRPDMPIDFRGPEDLARLVLCLPIGYALSPRVALMARAQLLGLHENLSPAGCLRQVELGRVDAVVLPRLLALYLQQHDVDTPTLLREATIPVERRWHFLIAPIASARSAAVIAAFNQGRERLQASGAWDRIISRHIGLAALNWTRLQIEQIGDEN